MIKIGMVVAVEMDALLAKYGESEVKEEFGGFTYRKYTEDQYELHVLEVGMGEIAAAAGTQYLISVKNVQAILNYGVVGGLTEGMKSTKTCVVTKVVHYGYDVSPIDPVKRGQYEFMPDEFIPVDEKLAQLACEIEPSVKKVICASADLFVADLEAKQSLNQDFGAEICDMESAAIALTCYKNQIPCVMIKTVADALSGDGKDYYDAKAGASDIAFEIASRLVKEI